MRKDLLSVLDVKEEIPILLEMAGNMKKWLKAGQPYEPLRGKTLAMIFEKSSTRTRVSFEVGMAQLGGHALYLSPKDLQMGRGETVADTARVLSRYVDCIMYRAFRHEMMVELAQNAAVPVINGLDDVEHPCQILADLMTIQERKGEFAGRKLAYVGDGNNVCNSLLLGAAAVGMNISVACPKGYWPNGDILRDAEKLAKKSRSRIEVTEDPNRAAEEADALYTDVWVSMGDEEEKEERERVFKPYQINQPLLDHCKPGAVVLHCLPAHRGLEITDDVIDGGHSAVWDQAENRLHVQKAILVALMGGHYAGAGSV